jgi:Fic family protein
MTRARALRASNSVEGINVSEEDAIAAVDGEDPAEADRPTWRAVVGYRQAMDYILQRCRDESFRFSRDALLAVHFMITQDDLKSNPGNLRPGWVGVRNSQTGELVHEGVDRELLEPILDELMAYMNDATEPSILIKAAMAHLNLAMLHPFSDGNGRVARCFQTAVLAKEGIPAPIFSSIEEYIGRHQQDYYGVLSEVGGGGWNPGRDCGPWVRFCITAHFRQAQTLLRRSKEFERVYEDLSNLVVRHGLPERTTFALVEAAFGNRVRNASYRVSADISNNLASRDLKALVDLRLLVPQGEKRGRDYIASETVRNSRDRNRLPNGSSDPFAA